MIRSWRRLRPRRRGTCGHRGFVRPPPRRPSRCDDGEVRRRLLEDGGQPPEDRQVAVVGEVAGVGVSGEQRSEEHTSELQSRENLVCRLLLDPPRSEFYTLSLHDALPISSATPSRNVRTSRLCTAAAASAVTV